MIDSPGLLGVVVAALGGAAVGIERQRSGHASGVRARFGGVRTFTLLGGVAGLAGWLTLLQFSSLALVLAAGSVALVVAGYLAASRTEIDATTEVAALVVIAAGMSAGLGWVRVASGVIAVSVLLLVEKSQLHALVARIDDEELRAAARFGVMAIVILPLLPEGPIGPWGGIRPRALWLLVLFFTGLSFIGYLARRIFGATQGYQLAGLLAGLISSTNVTFTFARLSRHEHWLSRPLAVGTIAACTVLFPRVLIATLVLNAAVARALLPYLAMPFAVGVIVLGLSWRTGQEAAPPSQTPSNPLQIRPALEMACLFQIVLFVVDGVRHVFGESGVLISGAVLGLTDVDALTISMARVGAAGVPPVVAAKAIAIGILANCVLKLGLALLYGTTPFRRLTAAALSTMAVTIAVVLAIIR
jgi:uncharacterized membrane protein (DUF4010 family)